ncbi:expressed unknown protein [Seminavis robusta]|uniref:Uncharacterized protein n=1 Tax=Seminavis robusta TaxID=568900 RepID=A0A9N8DZ09_9STRA|nr:expressed unknown protein [Seminavis robusta]|eukprot:Sro389_g132680.1 n/a (474) ;mRNA; r:53397-54818
MMFQFRRRWLLGPLKLPLVSLLAVLLAVSLVEGFGVHHHHRHHHHPRNLIIPSSRACTSTSSTPRTQLSMMMSLFGRQRRHTKKSEEQSPTTTSASTSTPSSHQWTVYVDQSKPSLDRGASATLDAFLGLAPPSTIRVVAATFGTPSGSGTTGTVVVDPNNAMTSSGATTSSYHPASNVVNTNIANKKTKGPHIRCISTGKEQKCLDVSNVDSVDKVYRILTKYLAVSTEQVPYQFCDCLKWKYKGNAHLEAGKFDPAVQAYNAAIQIIGANLEQPTTDGSNSKTAMIQPQQVQQQKGILLLMRATAYLQRASSHKIQLRTIVEELMKMVPDATKLKRLYEQTAGLSPAISHSMFRKVLVDSWRQEDCFRRTQYWHGLYQFALLQAAQDVLQATQLLPMYSRGWARAGEILEELWKLSESAQYYEQAVQCDAQLEAQLQPVIDRLRKRQELLESARAYGWSEDTLRLALDVAG